MGTTTERFEGGTVGAAVTTSNTVLTFTEHGEFVADGRTGQGFGSDGVIPGEAWIETDPGATATATVDWRPTLTGSGGGTTLALDLLGHIPGDPGTDETSLVTVQFVETIGPAYTFRIIDWNGALDADVALPADWSGEWFNLQLAFSSGETTVTIRREDGSVWWTSSAIPAEADYLPQTARAQATIAPAFTTVIDNLSFTDRQRVTRLYPRDDGLGMSSAPRMYPPTKARRTFGGYR
jgi:hypothetical protein